MAKSLKINRTPETLQIFLDGVEIKDIRSYTLKEEPLKVPILTLEIFITEDSIEVLR